MEHLAKCSWAEQFTMNVSVIFQPSVLDINNDGCWKYLDYTVELILSKGTSLFLYIFDYCPMSFLLVHFSWFLWGCEKKGERNFLHEKL